MEETIHQFEMTFHPQRTMVKWQETTCNVTIHLLQETIHLMPIHPRPQDAQVLRIVVIATLLVNQITHHATQNRTIPHQIISKETFEMPEALSVMLASVETFYSPTHANAETFQDALLQYALTFVENVRLHALEIQT